MKKITLIAISEKTKITKTKLLLATVFVSLFFISCSSTQIASSWKDPNTSIQNASVHKIVVAALINNQSTRRQVEDYMASLYPGTATPSYQLFGMDSIIKNESTYNDLLRQKGYDGIAIMKQTDEKTSHTYVSGTPTTFYNSWGGYWNRGWGMSYYYSPGYTVTTKTWYIEVNAFSLIKNDLVWSAYTSTTNSDGATPQFHDVCVAVRKQMKKDGFLK